MKNEQSATEKGRVTDEWVRNNHSIDFERQTIPKDVQVSELDTELAMQKDKFMSKNDFILLVSRAVAKFDRVKFTYGGEYQFYEKRHLPETDKEVVTRLKSAEIDKRQNEALQRKEFKEYQRLKAIFEPTESEVKAEAVTLMFERLMK